MPRARRRRAGLRASAGRRWRRVPPPQCARCGAAAPSGPGRAGSAPTGPPASAGVRSAVWLDEGARARRCTASSTTAGGGSPRRWRPAMRSLEPLTRAEHAGADSARRAAAPQPGVQSGRAARGGAGRGSGGPVRRATCCAGARDTPHPDRAHARGAPRQRGRRVRGRRRAWPGSVRAGGRRLHHRRHARRGRGGAAARPGAARVDAVTFARARCRRHAG